MAGWNVIACNGYYLDLPALPDALFTKEELEAIRSAASLALCQPNCEYITSLKGALNKLFQNGKKERQYA